MTFSVFASIISSFSFDLLEISSVSSVARKVFTLTIGTRFFLSFDLWLFRESTSDQDKSEMHEILLM